MATSHGSSSIHWGTPFHVYEALDIRFKFNLDACAKDESVALHKHFISEEKDALKQEWNCDMAGFKVHNVFMNPPYGRTIKAFMQKAKEQVLKHDLTVVCLIPNSTGTLWFKENVKPVLDEMIIFHKRMQFYDHDSSSYENLKSQGANFDSIAVVLKKNPRKEPIISFMDSRVI